MLGYGQLIKYKGKTFEVLISSGCGQDVSKTNGVLTNLIVGLGENGVFIELDNKKIINIRYVIKMEMVD